jgi:transposase
MSRSSLNDVFHRTAELLVPIWRRILELIAQSEHVSADETPIKVQDAGKCRKGWMWTFIARGLVAYVFSASRSGQTPVDVLGETSGTIQVDGYSGYNTISCPEGRTRCGCWAHARRKFWGALKYAPREARWVLDEILKLYEVEYEAFEKEIVGGDAHRLLRQAKSGPIVDGLFEWLAEQKEIWPPKSPLGKAIKYATNQKEALTQFVNEPKVRLDNNLSERHLRLVALGRKNFLFVGHDTGGKNLAILQTIVASCVANKVNPQAYLTDVIMRIQHHPQSRIDELLPNQWKPSG